MIGLGDPQTSGVGRRPMTASFEPSGPESETIGLDGTWQFHLAPGPGAFLGTLDEPEPGDFVAIEVPGCFTCQAHAAPHYTNVVMPWPLDPPDVPEENPTGIYRRTFEARAGERAAFLEIGGAESFAAVWLNGTFIGSGKDSRLPQVFDVTAALREGENRLTVAVVRYCDGSWLEDQDHWWQAGLHRSVKLHLRPKTRLGDVVVDAGLAEDLATGTLRVKTSIEGVRPGLTVHARLADGSGNELWQADGPLQPFLRESPLQEMAMAYLYRGPFVELSGEVAGVAPWSHEDPVLHELRVELRDENGPLESTSLRVGFRRVEIVGRELRINGRTVPIYGVNRHDHHPERGKTLTREEIRHDLVTLKRFGFNAVRCAHYPNDPALYELCDELGLYVVDEANIESHARLNSLSHDARWHPAFFERFTRMVQRDRNHPSIIGWSLGNESGYSAVHDAMAAWARRTDPSRFVQYEGASFHTSLDGGEAASDVVCPMYASVEDIVAWSERNATPRPLILCEYSHAMGNSNGGLADYFEAFETREGLQGGFIWDFKDQGLTLERDGRRFHGFGGHFGDEPNDANFCCNGIFGPNAEPRPAAFEHRQLATPVRAHWEDAGAGRVRIENRRCFSDLSDVACRYEASIDGRGVEHGRLELPRVGPGESESVDVPLKPPDARGREAHLTLFFETAADAAWAPAGETLGVSQLALPWPAEANGTAADGALPLGWAEGAPTLAGEPVLAGPIAPCLWRAPVDNDGVKQGPRRTAPQTFDGWLEHGLDRLAPGPVTRKGAEDRHWEHAAWIAPGANLGIDHERTIELRGDRFVIHETIDAPAEWSDLPRVGVTFRLPARFDRLAWFGLGPQETYPDRVAGAHLGIFEHAIGPDDSPYLVPQEFGAHAGTRWFRLTDADGLGIEVRLPEPLQFSATRFSADTLWRAGDVASLTPDPDITVHLDAAHRGVGTGACGPDTTHLVAGGRFRFTWELLPLRP